MPDAFRSLIAALSTHLGTTLELTGDNRVDVDFDNIALLITYLPETEQVLLAAALADIPAEGRPALYRELLQGQFLFERTGGATLALDPAETFILLQYAPPILALTRENFPAVVENFLKTADSWQERCQELTQVAAGEETTAGSALHPGSIRV